MNDALILEHIACADLSRAERVCLSMLYRGWARTKTELERHCFPGSPRPAKMNYMMEDLIDSRILESDGKGGWLVRVERLVHLHPLPSPSPSKSLEQSNLSIDPPQSDLGPALALLPPSQLGHVAASQLGREASRPGRDRPVPDGTCHFAKDLASRPGRDASISRSIMIDQERSGTGSGVLLNRSLIDLEIEIEASRPGRDVSDGYIAEKLKLPHMSRAAEEFRRGLTPTAKTFWRMLRENPQRLRELIAYAAEPQTVTPIKWLNTALGNWEREHVRAVV